MEHVVATVPGFDPGRLLAVYPWIPLASLVFFVLVLDRGLGGNASAGAEGNFSRAVSGRGVLVVDLSVSVPKDICSRMLQSWFVGSKDRYKIETVAER